MKRFLHLLSIFISICATAQNSTLQDAEGNKYRVKLMPDNLLWMIDNLKVTIPQSYCYVDMKQNCEQYGRLYTWEAAQKGCKSLGEGWRLATSDEWQQMAKQYGGVFGNSEDSGKTAFKALVTGGSSGFDVSLGGGRSVNGEYRRGDAHGFYWSATENGSTNASYFNFGKNSGKLYHQKEGEKADALSVRCVRLR